MRMKLTCVFSMAITILAVAFPVIPATDEYSMRRDVLTSAREMISAYKYMSKDKEKFIDIFIRYAHPELFRELGAITNEQKTDVARIVTKMLENALARYNANSYIQEISEVRSVFSHEGSTFAIIRSTIRFYDDGGLLLMTAEEMQLGEKITGEWRFMRVSAKMLQKIRDTQPLFYKKMNPFQLRTYSPDGTFVVEEENGIMMPTKKTKEWLESVLKKSKSK